MTDKNNDEKEIKKLFKKDIDEELKQSNPKLILLKFDYRVKKIRSRALRRFLFLYRTFIILSTFAMQILHPKNGFYPSPDQIKKILRCSDRTATDYRNALRAVKLLDGIDIIKISMDLEKRPHWYEDYIKVFLEGRYDYDTKKLIDILVPETDISIVGRKNKK